MTDEEDAWNNGYEVGFDIDGARADNPYPEGTRPYFAWLEGYNQGCEDFIAELETEDE